MRALFHISCVILASTLIAKSASGLVQQFTCFEISGAMISAPKWAVPTAADPQCAC
jgi:hypothetical protein